MTALIRSSVEVASTLAVAALELVTVIFSSCSVPPLVASSRLPLAIEPPLKVMVPPVALIVPPAGSVALTASLVTATSVKVTLPPFLATTEKRLSNVAPESVTAAPIPSAWTVPALTTLSLIASVPAVAASGSTRRLHQAVVVDLIAGIDGQEAVVGIDGAEILKRQIAVAAADRAGALDGVVDIDQHRAGAGSAEDVVLAGRAQHFDRAAADQASRRHG